MKRLIICLLTLAGLTNLHAQTTEKKTFEPVDIYHGVEAKYGFLYGADAGYYLQMHMRKRLYLFTDYAVGVVGFDGPVKDYNYSLYSTISFAFRLNGEDKQWQYFPYVGTSISIVNSYVNYVYPDSLVFPLIPISRSRNLDYGLRLSLNVGFEVKCRLKNNKHIGFGAEVNPSQGVCAFIRYGWNRPYRHK